MLSQCRNLLWTPNRIAQENFDPHRKKIIALQTVSSAVYFGMRYLVRQFVPSLKYNERKWPCLIQEIMTVSLNIIHRLCCEHVGTVFFL